MVGSFTNTPKPQWYDRLNVHPNCHDGLEIGKVCKPQYEGVPTHLEAIVEALPSFVTLCVPVVVCWMGSRTFEMLRLGED